MIEVANLLSMVNLVSNKLLSLIALILLFNISISSSFAEDVNLSFETGDGSGWTISGDETGTAIRDVVSGTQNTIIYNDEVSASNGNHMFFFDMDGPSSATLVKEISGQFEQLEVEVQYIVGSIAAPDQFYAYENDSSAFDLTFMSNNMWLRIDIIAAGADDHSLADADILATLFDSNSIIGIAIPSQGVWENYSVALSGFPNAFKFRVITVNTNDPLIVAVDNLLLTRPAAVPSIVSWNPSDLNPGQRISSEQLNAFSAVPGTFSYSVNEGDTISGNEVSITATFKPTDPNGRKWSAQKIIRVLEK